MLKERETEGATETERRGLKSLEKRVEEEALLRAIDTDEAIQLW